MQLSDKTIRNLSLYNFKGYRTPDNNEAKNFDLDADLVLITGKNGVGKTSLLEALDWVLNHSEDSAGSFLTSGAKEGAVTINGERFELKGKAKLNKGRLKSVSSFFYQENIQQLAHNEIIQLLEPENKPAAQMRASLKKLLVQLEEWQQQVQRMMYRKDYETERKRLAQHINLLTSALPDELPLKKELENSSLTLKNGNLQSRWESQIANLAASLSKITGRSSFDGGLDSQLNDIIQSLGEYKAIRSSESHKQDAGNSFDMGLVTRLNELRPSLPIKFIDHSASDDRNHPRRTDEFKEIDAIIISNNSNFYSEEIRQLESRQHELRTQFKKSSVLLNKLEGDDSSFQRWLMTFNTNLDEWREVWHGHKDEAKIKNITTDIFQKLSDLEDSIDNRSQELKSKLETIENSGKDLASKINRLKQYQVVSQNIESNKNNLSSLLEKPSLSVGELLDYVGEFSDFKLREKSDDWISNIDELANAFKDWADLELEKVVDESISTDLERIEQADSLISSAISICKSEIGARSQLLSSIDAIPKVELEQLVENMNELLASFHFPDDFLPISIENGGTEKNPAWGFKTAGNVKFEDLSTGQKTQLAICWTINLNLALSSTSNHKVIGFDDFTTSLDMNQLIPASVLIRKLAYAPHDDACKRQVFVTSHHEDLTNRLLDFLLPPKGKKMRVIEFDGWSSTVGPSFKCYKVAISEPEPYGVEAALERVAEMD